VEYGKWYLDDGSLGGRMEDPMVAFQILKMEAAKIGLHVIEKKCELIANDDFVMQRFQTVAPDITLVDPATTVLPGAPVGGQLYSQSTLFWKINLRS
jgi:hypothetical protein